jgi:hypothetical protein
MSVIDMHKDDRAGGGALALRPAGSGLALAELADEARGYVAASLAPATRRAYATDRRIFSTWCAERGVEPLPADPRTLVLYLYDMAGQRSTALLARRLTSISLAHRHAGYDPSPTTDPLVRRA